MKKIKKRLLWVLALIYSLRQRLNYHLNATVEELIILLLCSKDPLFLDNTQSFQLQLRKAVVPIIPTLKIPVFAMQELVTLLFPHRFPVVLQVVLQKPLTVRIRCCTCREWSYTLRPLWNYAKWLVISNFWTPGRNVNPWPRAEQKLWYSITVQESIFGPQSKIRSPSWLGYSVFIAV